MGKIQRERGKKSTDMGDEKRETDRESEWCIEKEKGDLKEMERWDGKR